MSQSKNGWDASAKTWISNMGMVGDRGRETVLDTPMMARVRASGARDMVDIGCGEGRFCRLAQQAGLKTIGIDPTQAFITQAMSMDGQGAYIKGMAESLPLKDASCDLVVFYLCFMDIPDIAAAISEAVRILRPKGRILIANLASFITVARHNGWTRHADGTCSVHFRDYLKEDSFWAELGDVRIKNWHRPTSFYMDHLLKAGMTLVHFDEPSSTHKDPKERVRYANAAYFTLMEWQKPA